MVEHSDAKRVLHVQSFHAGHVASRLSHTLTETHYAVVQESTSVSIGRKRVCESCGREKKEFQKIAT